MDFVPQNGGLVLFGGSAPFVNGETWLYDGSNWSQLSPANSPGGRFGAEFVYDSARAVGVLYGGLASNISIPPPTNETWEWDGANWTQATPTNNAGPRYRYGACFDFVRSRLVMFGGTNTQLLSPPINQTWEYDGTTWSQITTAGTPGGRDRPAMCFYPGLVSSVMFGGYNGSSLTDETWLYDGIAWTQVAITGSKPSPRNAAKMIYDPVRGHCVLTGGQDVSGQLSDTWIFDGATWTEQPGTTQTIRDHAFAFLPTTAQAIKFGGFESAPNNLSNQTWELGTGIYGSGCAGSNGVPTLTATSAMQLGQNWTVDIDNLNPTFNLAYVVLGLTKSQAVDLSVINMPGCFAFTTPDLLLSVTGTAGQASWTWPAVAGPIGAALYAQALCLDPTVNTFGFTTSNAVFTTITN
tara:strand:+ start:1714 stop:2940 length:1227 start_codon:yes stop_codon:yes gene_type:complete